MIKNIIFGNNRLYLLIVAGLLILLLLNGCAVFNRDNTPTLNYVEKKMTTENKVVKYTTLPLVFPVGLIAITADAFIVHPALIIDDCYEEVHRDLWTDMDFAKKYATECTVLPWRTVLTPVWFTMNFIGRSMFDIEGIADEAVKIERETGNLNILNDYVKNKQYIEADAFLRRIKKQVGGEKAEVYDLLVLETEYKSGIMDFSLLINSKNLFEGEHKDEADKILQEMKKSENPSARIAYYDLAVHYMEGDKEKSEFYRGCFSDQAAIVRYEGLRLLETHTNYLRWRKPSDDEYKYIKSLEDDLKNIAEKDTEEINRTAAKRMLLQISEPRETPEEK